MTLEQIQRDYPLGTRVKWLNGPPEEGSVVSYHQYIDPGGYRHGTYYLGWVRDTTTSVSHSWPDHLLKIKPLTDLERGIKAYIDEEMKQLVG
jgi:hypothetical protein